MCLWLLIIKMGRYLRDLTHLKTTKVNGLYQHSVLTQKLLKFFHKIWFLVTDKIDTTLW